MNCDWQPTGNGNEKKCRRCTNRVFTDDPPERCYGECLNPPDGPPLVERARNFAKAVFRQLPITAVAIIKRDESIAFRSREEIQSLAAICKQCPLFNGQVCTHQNCGCVIDEERSEYWSKLAYRSTSCPDGKW